MAVLFRFREQNKTQWAEIIGKQNPIILSKDF